MRQFSVERVLNNVRYVSLLLLASVLLLAPSAWGQQNKIATYVSETGVKVQCGKTATYCPALGAHQEVVKGTLHAFNPLVATAKPKDVNIDPHNISTFPQGEIHVTGASGSTGTTWITYQVKHRITGEITQVYVPVEVTAPE